MPEPVRVELTPEQITWTLEVLRVIRHEHEWPAVEKALRNALEAYMQAPEETARA